MKRRFRVAQLSNHNVDELIIDYCQCFGRRYRVYWPSLLRDAEYFTLVFYRTVLDQSLSVIGNAEHVSIAEPWLTYTAWKKIYGDLICVRLIGLEFIVINSDKTAYTILD
ncbi:uncharacterized protein EDB91DRAFT_1051793 [Suillus paluster]|uniref:uncharacterized protein n=1 Tax=Suillus paluster TaxID=48578 RepID=UPI001B8734B2|nr:uncharacterized protein EDB91DRAFT_1051793 [Suillus paluster]KAG1742640.1 hypothetical protein EDB91DRAFT_1051793 [Suillus paluster]